MIDKSNYKKLIEDIEEVTTNITIIEGIVDVYFSQTVLDINHYEIKDASESFWVILGKADDDNIKGCLEDYTFVDESIEGEGEYNLKAVLKYDRVDNGYGYWYIDYIEIYFIQTFLEREREEKLFKLLGNDLGIFS